MNNYIVNTSLSLSLATQEIRRIRSTIETGLSGINISVNAKVNSQLGDLGKKLNTVADAGKSIPPIFTNINRGFGDMGKKMSDAVRTMGKYDGAINNLKKSNKGLLKANDELVPANAKVVKGTNNAIQAYKQQQTALKNMAQAQKKAKGIVSGVSQSMNRQTDSVKALLGSYIRMSIGAGAVFGSIRQLNNVLQNNIALLREATNLAQLYGASVSSAKVQGVVEQIRSSGIKRGSDTKGVASSISSLEQSGVRVDSRQIDMMSQLSNNSQVGTEGLKEIVRNMVLLQNSYNMGTTAQRKFINSLLKSSKETSAEVSDTTAGFTIIGQSMKQFGKSAEYSLSVLTKLKDATGTSVPQIARQIQQITARLRSSPETRSTLEGLGIDIYELKGGEKRLRDFTDIITDAQSKINELGGDSPQGGAIVRALGGTRRDAVTIELLNKIEKIAGYATELENNGIDIISKDSAIFADTFLGKLGMIRNEFDLLGQNLANTKIFSGATDGLLKTASAIAQVGSALAEFIPLLGILAVSKIPAVQNLGRGIRTNLRRPIARSTRLGADGAGPDTKAFQRNREQLLKYYEREIAVKNRGLSVAQREVLARAKVNTAIIKNVRVWRDVNSKIQGIGVKGLTKSLGGLLGKLGGKGALITGLGAGLAGQFGGNSPLAESATSGLTASFGALMLGAGGLTAGLVGAGAALASFSSAVVKSTGDLESKRIADAKARQDAIASAEGSIEDQYKEMRKRYAGLDDLSRKAKNTTYKDITGGQGGWDDIGLSINALSKEFGKNFGFYKGRASSTLGVAQERFQERSKTESTQNAGDITRDIQLAIESQKYTTLEDFKKNETELYREGLKYNKELDKSIKGRLLSPEQAGGTIKTKRTPFDYIRRLQFGEGSLQDVGSPEYYRQTSRVPGLGRDALDIGRATKLLPSILDKVIGEGVPRDQILDRTRAGLHNKGIPESVYSPIIDTLSNQMENLTFDNLDETATKVLEEALKPLSDEIIRVTEEHQNSRQALKEFSSGLRDSISTQTQLGNRVSQGQLGIARHRRDFLGLGAQAGLGNAFIQSRATELGGSADTSTLGSNLKKFNEQLAIATKNQDEIAGDAIRTKIDKTKSALELLANTGERTSDALRKIQEQQRDQETRGRFARRVFGSDMAGRRDALRGMSEASMVQQQGLTWDQLTPETVNRVVSTLESLGSTAVAGTGGLSGDELLRMIDARTLGEDYIADDTKTLQKQVIATQLDSINATRELLGAEQNLQQQFFNNLSAENQKFLNGLGAVVGHKKMAQGGIVPGSGNRDKIRALLTPGELVIPKDKVKEFVDPSVPSRALLAQSMTKRKKKKKKFEPPRTMDIFGEREKSPDALLDRYRSGPPPLAQPWYPGDYTLPKRLDHIDSPIESQRFKGYRKYALGGFVGKLYSNYSKVEKRRKKRLEYLDKRKADKASRLSALGRTPYEVRNPSNKLNPFDKLLNSRKASRVAKGGGGPGIIDKGLQLASSTLKKMNAPESMAYKKPGDHLSGAPGVTTVPKASRAGAESASKPAETSTPTMPAIPDLGPMSALAGALTAFAGPANGLAEALHGFPSEVSHTGHHTVEVLVNGASVLQGLEGSVRSIVVGEINKAMKRYTSKHNFPPVDD